MHWYHIIQPLSAEKKMLPHFIVSRVDALSISWNFYLTKREAGWLGQSRAVAYVSAHPHAFNSKTRLLLLLRSWLPDVYSQIFRSYAFGPSGFWTLAPLCNAAKFDPFIFLDGAPTPSTLAQSKRKESNLAIWQHCFDRVWSTTRSRMWFKENTKGWHDDGKWCEKG